MMMATSPGAQTERRGGAGPVRGLLGGKASPAAFFAAHKSRVSVHRGRARFDTLFWGEQGTGAARPDRRQKSSAETTSLPARVISAARTRMLRLALRKRTDPSANTALAPPG